MTDRSEIERLLSMTGRTLDDLPKEWSAAKLVAVKWFADDNFGSKAKMLCHQSDVIELLIEALRDALEKQRVESPKED